MFYILENETIPRWRRQVPSEGGSFSTLHRRGHFLDALELDGELGASGSSEIDECERGTGGRQGQRVPKGATRVMRQRRSHSLLLQL